MLYPALDIEAVDPEMLLAIVDDYSPTAAEECGVRLTVFFAESTDRDRAGEAVARALPQAIVAARDVDDEDWARRSQEHLKPVTVGRITVFPKPSSRIPDPDSRMTNHESLVTNHESQIARGSSIALIIQPSMGFGTGHHATTRLCLVALQEIDVTGVSALDIGTGSGVLALALRQLGATYVLGIDNDPDAIHSAAENLKLNPTINNVHFEVADLKTAALPAAGLVTANLTGSLLSRSGLSLTRAVGAGGTLIVSGLLMSEETDVRRAFAPMRVRARHEEDGWLCLTLDGPVAEDV